MTMDHDLDLDPTGREKIMVPYRLPRISPRSVSPVDAVVQENRPRREDTMWGRFGYEATIRYELSNYLYFNIYIYIYIYIYILLLLYLKKKKNNIFLYIY